MDNDRIIAIAVTALLVIILGVMLFFADFPPQSSVVRTMHEVLVFDSPHCKVYEVTITDASGLRRVYVSLPHPPKPSSPLRALPNQCGLEASTQ